MGRHSGAVCRACEGLILVREGRLIEHRQHFPTLGTSLPCVGSHSAAPDEETKQGSPIAVATSSGRRPAPAWVG